MLNRIKRTDRISLYFILTILVLILVSCEDEGGTSIITSSGSNFLAVAGETTLFIKDLDTGSWLPAELGLGNAPNWIIPDEERLYVISSMSNQLHVFYKSEDGIELEREVDLGLEYNRNPYSAALTHDNRLLITNIVSNNLSVLNLNSWEIDTLWNTGLAPEGVAVDENFAYVVNSNYENYSYNSGSVYKFDLESGEMIDSITVGYNSQFVEIDAEGRLHVLCTGNFNDIRAEIWVIDPSTGFDLIQILEIDGYPVRIKIGYDGTAYLVSGGWFSADIQRGQVTTYNSLSFEFGTCYYPAIGAMNIAISSDDDVYIGCYDSNTIFTIQNGAIIDSVQIQEPVNTLAIWTID